MDPSVESNAKEGLSVFQRALHVPNAMRNLLIKISKLKNIGHTAASGLHAAMVGAFSNPDPSAANTPGCPASPRPVHATISDGSRGNGDNIEQSSQTAPLSPPGSVLGTDGTQDEGSQHPHPSLIFGNYGPPPGIAGVVHQAGNQSPRRLSPPPGFGPPFGSRRYPPGFRPPVMFEKCFSLASTRIYDNTLSCDRCGRGSDFGWFYRCCHNTDTRLFESIKDGHKECFDEIGEVLTRDLKPPERGAAARQDKLSPLKEMSPGQLHSYTSEQLVTVLKQHENAVDTALSDRYGPFVPRAEERPYIVDQAEECKATLCPRCGRGGVGEDLSWLSLDGVLKGDIPASAAVGYGFRALGGRPVANANIVKNLGLRDPKTGRLPEQQPKEDENHASENEDASWTTEEGEVKTPGEANDAKEELLATPARVNLLAMGDWKVPPEMERLDAASIMADKGSEGNEDFIDLYVDSEEANTSGRHVAETRQKESPKDAQNDKSGAQ